MLSNTFAVAIARGGAVLPGVRFPWATKSCAGANHALTQFPVPAVRKPNTRPGASWRAPAMAQPTALMAAALPTRKQYVHKTRVNAGGDGASGPHPEREPA